MPAQTVLEELTGDDLTRDHVERRVDDWARRIEPLYEEIDRGFDSEHRDARTAGDEASARRIEQKQLLNDQAYFVLCWGQVETEIDEACRTAIRRRQSNASWDVRRGFDFYDPDD